MSESTRPVAVTIIAWHVMLSAVLGGVAVLYAARIYKLATFTQSGSSIAQATDREGYLLAFACAVSLMAFMSGFLLLKGIAWGRFLYAGTCLLSFVFALNTSGPSTNLLAGTILPAISLGVLFSGRSAAFFAAKSSNDVSLAGRGTQESIRDDGSFDPSDRALIWLVLAGQAIACAVILMAWWPHPYRRATTTQQLVVLGVAIVLTAILLGFGLLQTPPGKRRRVAGLTLLWSSAYASAVVFFGVIYLLSDRCPRDYKQRVRNYSINEAFSGLVPLVLCGSLGYACIRGTSVRKPLEKM